MLKLWKSIKEWGKDWNHLQKELNDMGVFTVYHTYGASTHYIDMTLNTHINTADDKPSSLQKDIRNIKK